MIKFACHCSHAFALPDDQAGGMIQCPKCGRLNDIPRLGDLEHLESDGIFKLEDEKNPAPLTSIADVGRAFGKHRQDNQGHDIDLRPNLEEFLAISGDEIPLAVTEDVLPDAPKYDPVSGE